MTKIWKIFVAILCGCMVLPACTKQEEPQEKPVDELHAFLDGRWQAVREEYYFMGKLALERSVPPGKIIYNFSSDFPESCLRETKDDMYASVLKQEGNEVKVNFFDPYNLYNLELMKEEDTFRLKCDPVHYTGNPDELIKRIWDLEGGYPTYCSKYDGGLTYYKKDDQYIRFINYGFLDPGMEEVTVVADCRICYFKRIK